MGGDLVHVAPGYAACWEGREVALSLTEGPEGLTTVHPEAPLSQPFT